MSCSEERKQSEYSFEARWGSVILDGGISTTPTIILEHQGELGLTNGELVLVVQVFSYKWSGRDPYVFASTLAERMGTTAGYIHKLTHGLKMKDYLVRYCVDREKNRWVWDFSGLLKAALNLEGGTSGPGDAVSEPEPEAVPDPVPERVSGGHLPIGKGGGLPIGKTEEEPVEEEKKTTTADSSDTPDDLSGKESQSDVVVVESEPKSTPNTDPDPAVEERPENPAEDPEGVTEIIEELRKIGICNCLAAHLIKQYGVVRITEVLNAVKALPHPPKNAAGWVRKALEEEWIVRCPQTEDPQGTQARENFERAKREAIRRDQEEVERIEAERKKQAEASPHRQVWEEMKGELSKRIVRQSVHTWFEPCYLLDVTEDRIILSAATAFAAEWIMENYEGLLREIAGCDVEVVADGVKRAA